MTRIEAGQDAREPDDSHRGNEIHPPGSSRFRRGVPRCIALLGCCALVFWSCLKLYDNQHVAARSARGLLSVQASDRIVAIHELEGSGREDTEVAIPALIRGLQDTDTEVRAAAATALISVVPGVGGANAPSERNVQAALRALVKSIEDRQASVRAAATRALWVVILVARLPAGTADFEAGTTALIERLDDPDPAVRVSAIQGLGAVASKALGEPPARLVAAMEDESEKSCEAAIEALSNFRQALPPLIPSLVRRAEVADPRIRAGYLKLLGRIRPPKFSDDAVPGLIAAIASKDAGFVAVAANDLLAYEGPAAPYFERQQARSDAPTAVPALITALIPLIDSTANDELTRDPVVAIAQALGRLAPDTPSSEKAVAALSKDLRAGDTRRRVAAARALGRFPPGDALFTALSDMISEPDFAVRLAVIGAIYDVEFGAPFVIPKALGAALEDESAEVRTAAASALWRAGTGIDAYVPALLRHAERDANERVREVCAGTLQHVAQPRYLTPAVLPDLIKALASRDPTVRFVASEIVAALGPAAAPAIPALVQSLREPSAKKTWRDPRAAAAKALGRIAPRTPMAEKAITALIEASRVDETELKNEAVRALAEFGPAAAPALPQLIQVMKEARNEKVDRIAISSAVTLLKIGSKDVGAAAIHTLREIAEQGTNLSMRSNAAQTLIDLKVTD